MYSIEITDNNKDVFNRKFIEIDLYLCVSDRAETI
jgi:hypothetical protein